MGGPTAIDIAFQSICYGQHDLSDDTLHYLYLTILWLTEALKLKENYEVMNAYLYRVLYLHGTLITNHITTKKKKEDEACASLQLAMKELRKEHHLSSKKLEKKCQYTLCLLRHFLQMV